MEQTTSIGKIQHIWCSAAITKKMEDVFIGFILNQAQTKQNISEYVIYLNTMGGSPFSAITLYNFIKSIPQKTTVYNMGIVASAGVPFFLGFGNRMGVPDCSFMIHQTSVPRSSLPENVNVFDLETQKVGLSATDDNTQKLILKETKMAKKPLTSTKIKQAFLKSTTYNTQAALQHGFIDKIEIPTIPTEETLYITDQYLATLQG